MEKKKKLTPQPNEAATIFLRITPFTTAAPARENWPFKVVGTKVGKAKLRDGSRKKSLGTLLLSLLTNA